MGSKDAKRIVTRKHAGDRPRRSGRKKVKRRGDRARPTDEISLETLFSDYTNAVYTKRLEQQQGQFMADLADAYLRRGLVLYLGAGVSQSLGLQSWAELIRDLTVGMMYRDVEKRASKLDPTAAWGWWEKLQPIHEEFSKTRKQDSPMLVQARAVKDRFGDEVPAWIASTLYGRLQWAVWPKNPNQPPSEQLLTVLTYNHQKVSLPTSPLMEAIVVLARAERKVEGVRAIVNYNFDVLVDETLRSKDVRCVTVISGKQRVPDQALPCYHVHGVLPLDGIPMKAAGPNREESIGNFVFGEDEYHAEYADPYRWSNMTQMSLLGQYTGLFIGLSMTDPDIRRLIEVTHKQYPDRTHYAILTRRQKLKGARSSKQTILQNLYEEVETDSFKSLGVRVLWVDRHEDVPGVLFKISKSEQGASASNRSEPEQPASTAAKSGG